MSNITDTKPEPISAKPNWHYDSYFLAQLKRLNLHNHDSQAKTPRKVNIKISNREVELEIGQDTDD